MWASELEVIREMISALLDEKLQKIYSLNLKGLEESPVLKSKDVKEKLKISDGKLQALRVNGILTAQKVGGTYYYSTNEVNRLMPQG